MPICAVQISTYGTSVGDTIPAPINAPSSRRSAQRSLGGDMEHRRIEALYARSDSFARREGQANFAISGTRHRAKHAGIEQQDFVPEAFEAGCRLSQRADDAVGLWRPRVGHDGYSHVAQE